MSAFLVQLGWELRKLWTRPRTHLGFLAALVCEGLLTALFLAPSVRAHMGTYVWHNTTWAVADVFSGLTSAVHVAGETALLIASPFLALVASDLVAKELEDGTLRTLLCRPVSRARLLAQKLIVGTLYTSALTIVVAAGALAFGLLMHGSGRLLISVPAEGIFGYLEPGTGLARYALALPFLAASALTVTLLALALSCFDVKPGAVTVLTLALLLVDDLVRLQPAFIALRPYCLTTRLMSWRQVFCTAIPWLRIERNYTVLVWADLLLIVVAWIAFERRELLR